MIHNYMSPILPYDTYISPILPVSLSRCVGYCHVTCGARARCARRQHWCQTTLPALRLLHNHFFHACRVPWLPVSLPQRQRPNPDFMINPKVIITRLNSFTLIRKLVPILIQTLTVGLTLTLTLHWYEELSSGLSSPASQPMQPLALNSNQKKT